MAFRNSHPALSAAVFAVLLVPALALAEPTAADRETARAQMQEGRDLRDKGNLQEALKRFQAADQIMHVPTTGFEVARTQVALGMLVEARDTVAAIRKMPSSANDPEPFNTARVKAEDLDKSLEGRIPALTIVVRGAAEGQTPTVTIDGAPLAPAMIGLPRSVDPGHHTVTAKTETGGAQQEVDVAEKEQKELQLTLEARPPSGESIEAHPGEGEALLSSLSHGPSLVTYGGLGVAGAGLVLGAVTGIVVLSKKPSLERDCPGQKCPPPYQGELSSANTFATLSTVSFIAAGIGASVAVVSLIVGHREAPGPGAPAGALAPEARLRVAPWIGLGSAGLSGVF